MDCEKFDRVALDLLYGELDELTAAAARRHMEHCARCGPIGSGLRATREVGVLPLLDPPTDLEARILSAERQAHAGLPLRARVGRAVSVLAGYAMRPQLAMAALLLLVLASSLLLLRARPGDRDAMRVTERGVPEIEGEAVIVPVPEKPAESDPGSAALQAKRLPRETGARPVARDTAEHERPDRAAKSAKGAAPTEEQSRDSADNERKQRADADAYDQAMAKYHAGRYSEAQRSFEAIASAGGPNAPSAALFAAQSVRQRAGCAAAAPRFEAVASRYPGISVAHEASWQAATCYRSLGQVERARQGFLALRSAQGYRERALRALDALDRGAVETQVASRKAAARAKPAAPAKPRAPTTAESDRADPSPPRSQRNAPGF